VTFEFNPALGIVIVSTQFTPADTFAIENPLRDLLYDHDSGLSSPNPVNELEEGG
jgi:hypothetical protein